MLVTHDYKKGYFDVATGMPGYEYSIPEEDVNSPEKALRWLLHLSEKTWFSKAHLRDFLLCWSESTGRSLRGC